MSQIMNSRSVSVALMTSLPFQSIGLVGSAMAAPVTNVIEQPLHVVSAKAKTQADECDIDDLIASLEKEHDLGADLSAARRWLAEGEPESLATLRLRKGMSQSQLAAQVGLRQPNISAIEAGKRKPEYATALRIAKALDVSIEELYAVLEKTT